MSNNAPCKGCADRKPHCHSSCAKYAEFKVYVAKVSQNRKNAADERNFFIDMAQAKKGKTPSKTFKSKKR